MSKIKEIFDLSKLNGRINLALLITTLIQIISFVAIFIRLFVMKDKILIAFSIIIAVGIIVDLILIRLKGVQLEDIKVSIDIPKEEVKEEQPKE